MTTMPQPCLFPPRLLTPLCLLIPGLAGAAELVIRDLQANTWFENNEYRYQLASPARSSDGRDSFTLSGALELGGRYSLARPGDALGVVFGLDLVLREAMGSSASLRGFLGRGSVGIANAFSDRWLAAFEVGGGFGYGQYTLAGTRNFPTYSSSGPSIAYDCRLQASYLGWDQVRLSGFCGYSWTTSRFSADQVDLTIRQDSIFVGIGVAYVFSRAPTRVK